MTVPTPPELLQASAGTHSGGDVDDYAARAARLTASFGELATIHQQNPHDDPEWRREYEKGRAGRDRTHTEPKRRRRERKAQRAARRKNR